MKLTTTKTATGRIIEWWNPYEISTKGILSFQFLKYETPSRKTLRNALKPLIKEGMDTSDPVFDLRAERLGVEDFVALTLRFQD